MAGKQRQNGGVARLDQPAAGGHGRLPRRFEAIDDGHPLTANATGTPDAERDTGFGPKAVTVGLEILDQHAVLEWTRGELCLKHDAVGRDTCRKGATRGDHA